MIKNMLVPGQVEKWVALANINQFPLKDLPVTLFRECAFELGLNYIDRSGKSLIVNMTWMQTLLVKMFTKLLDVETRSRQIFAERPDTEELRKFVYPSQLETTYGGTAPVVT